jgi:hypothetical protein
MHRFYLIKRSLEELQNFLLKIIKRNILFVFNHFIKESRLFSFKKFLFLIYSTKIYSFFNKFLNVSFNKPRAVL